MTEEAKPMLTEEQKFNRAIKGLSEIIANSDLPTIVLCGLLGLLKTDLELSMCHAIHTNQIEAANDSPGMGEQNG